METYFNSVHFDQYLLLRGWEEQFQSATFVVQNFDEVQDTVENFKNISGITYPKDIRQNQNLNPSVPHAFFEICRLALSQTPKSTSKYLISWIASNADHLEFPKNSSVDMFGSDLRRKIFERFQPIHLDLSRFVGVDKFYPDLDEILHVPPLSDVKAAKKSLPSLIDKLKHQRDIPNGLLAWLRNLNLEFQSI